MARKSAVNGAIARMYQILGTNLVVINAWEPTGLMGNHSTVTGMYGEDGARMPGFWGRIGTKRGEDSAQQFARAQEVILEAFPEVVGFEIKWLYGEALINFNTSEEAQGFVS